MSERSRSKGVLPPVKSGHAVLKIGNERYPGIFWIKLDRATVNIIEHEEYAIIYITLPNGEEIIKKVSKNNLFQGNKIAIYRRSDGSWALRNFMRDRKIAAKHKPERIRGILKGMTGDMPKEKRKK